MKIHSTDAIRAFIAYRIPLEVAAVIYKKAHHHVGETTADHLCWVAPQDYHLTLRFLGHCSQEQLEKVSINLRKALEEVPPFRCMTGEVGFFPSANQPRVMALMVHSGQVMSQLFEVCGGIADEAGVTTESRQFRPHVTLARFPAHAHRLSLSAWRLPGFHLTVSDIALIESDLSQQRPRYSVMNLFPLQPLSRDIDKQ